ncbi:hypothetical protein F2Q69_00023086 [Brassica cretica]|uniref:Uncharacterized protein n=1 Tax=Brassica cretica TaxID=69181 RepID=A0A8S9QKI2_BRACR|nr:hypothetical protein F2Q69_00023086 [Brassica cretica]
MSKARADLVSLVVGTLDPEPGSWDPEPGRWDTEPRSWNPEPRELLDVVLAFSLAPLQGFFAEQLQWNPTSTHRRSIHLAISISRSSSSDSSCLEALMASRACYVAASPGPVRTEDCRGLTCGLGPGPSGTEDCRGLTCGLGPGPAGTSRNYRVNHGSGEKKLFLAPSAKLLGYFCVQAISAQLYGVIGGRRHVVECIILLRYLINQEILLLGYFHMGGTWPEQMVDLSICCSEHDVSMCFSEYEGTLRMSWRPWPEPASEAVLEPEGLDPEIADWNPEVILTPMRLRMHRGSSFYFIFGTPKPHRNPEVLP